jgi:hypothetical protein
MVASSMPPAETPDCASRTVSILQSAHTGPPFRNTTQFRQNGRRHLRQVTTPAVTSG